MKIQINLPLYPDMEQLKTEDKFLGVIHVGADLVNSGIYSR